MRLLLIVLFVCAVLVISPAIGATATQPDAPGNRANDAARNRIIAPLIAAGINIDSNEAVINALSNRNLLIVAGAIFLIAERKEKLAIPELRKLLGSEYDIIRFYACKALAELGDKKRVWRILCIGLLQSEESIVSLRAAGLLAVYGDYQGWPIVLRGLQKENTVFEASLVAAPFNGKTPPGEETPISVIGVTQEIFKQTNAEGQLALVTLYSKVAAEDDLPKLEALAAQTKSKGITDDIQRIIDRLKKEAQDKEKAKEEEPK